jgi:hypothetical protein
MAKLQGDQLEIFWPGISECRNGAAEGLDHGTLSGGSGSGDVLGDAGKLAPSPTEHPPEQNYRRPGSGWLESYSVRRGQKDYMYTRFVWQDGWRGRKHRRHVPAGRVAEVLAALVARRSAAEIALMLTQG